MIPDLTENLHRHGGGIRRRLAVLPMLILALVALAGCEQPEGIVTYKIPKKVPEQLAPGKDRLLAVMVPRGEKVWFFKVLGPEDAVARIDDAFKAFVKSVQFDANDEPVLESLPDGWRRGGKKPMRFATIDINTPEKQLDLSVSNLSVPGTMDDAAWDDYVQQNVNRWRGQVGLDPSTEKWSGGEAMEVDAAQGNAVWVDLVGVPGAGGAGPMGMMSGAGMPNGGMPGTGMPSAGPLTSPSGGATAAAAPPSPLEFETPDGWNKLEVRPGGMREAAFSVDESEVTVITAGGDLRSNVARWMGQVAGGSPEDTAVDEMLAGAKKFDVSGRPAQRFIIAGDAEKGQKSIDATIVEMAGGRSKFIKMTGDAKTVAEQSDAMQAFLDSLSF
ncbi:hypothetical protein Mal15_07120 [Stieleria maiorica]|uniref:Uncharacterized protein n=1 Tax=Stieleria maiorica TaxID=2795974 RepID=A0A5B9MAW6_9BACT|nr:hypothetical protein [Stieleria maiorica]QEF96684.1 hypothetical protein Mal15_07120 [Stieleria maiorica]